MISKDQPEYNQTCWLGSWFLEGIPAGSFRIVNWKYRLRTSCGWQGKCHRIDALPDQGVENKSLLWEPQITHRIIVFPNSDSFVPGDCTMRPHRSLVHATRTVTTSTQCRSDNKSSSLSLKFNGQEYSWNLISSSRFGSQVHFGSVKTQQLMRPVTKNGSNLPFFRSLCGWCTQTREGDRVQLPFKGMKMIGTLHRGWYNSWRPPASNYPCFFTLVFRHL